ncbi:MAG TPA: hypothetical protein VHY20_00805, partial [Pirellulales bacterium]|nr:hypothetical protein [Pirellulales bacterium]
AEMADVVNLLLKAQEQLPAEREATFVEARKKTREVVVRLSIERQNLLRRLKTAELAAQVKRLIALQTIVTNATELLPAQPSSRQEAALVATIQDERDVEALFTRLVEMLRDVRGWGGEVGQGAAAGLAILRTAGVGSQLTDAIADLEMAEFARAGEDEAAVLKGLRLLLEKIEETQGLVGTDRELALENVRQLMAQQQQLRDDTRAAELDEGTIDKLIQRQAQVQKEIGRLPEMLGRVPAALPAVEAARKAASDASAKLFDGKRPEAVARQTAVAAQLATAEQQLLAAAHRPDGVNSAAQLEKLAQALGEAQRQIEQAQADTTRAEAAAGKLPRGETQRTDAAQRPLVQAAQRLAAIKPDAPLSEAVTSAIEEAAEATHEAAQANAPQRSDRGAADKAVQEAKQAQQHAQSEVAAALADARREMLATRSEELSQAAEALDRAAGAQRDVAEQAAKAAQAEGLSPGQAKDLAAREAAIADVAKKVAQAVKRAVPEVANPLEQAQAAIDAAARELAENSPAPGKADAARTSRSAEAAVKSAEAAVKPLATAAQQLRAAAGQAARELDAESRRQLDRVNPVRDAAAQMSMTSPAANNSADKLPQAERKVRAALAQQYRAGGHPEAAQASELADRLQQAEEQQRAVAQAAERPGSASQAAARQQQIAQQVRQAQRDADAVDPSTADRSQQSSAELKAAIEQAAQATAAAAKAMQAGQGARAREARNEAQGALAAAHQAAGKRADQAAAEPPEQPRGELQPRVTSAIEEARRLASDQAPQAENLLKAAQPASQAAQHALESG